MPSIFTSRQADLVETACPQFSEALARNACDTRQDVLENELRQRVGREWACNQQDPLWETAGSNTRVELFPSPPGAFEAPEVTQLRQVLPPELLAPINGSGLSLAGQLVMANTLKNGLASYNSLLERERASQQVQRQRLQDAFGAAWARGYPPSKKPDATSQGAHSVIPTGQSNTITTQRRYFRVLVWNLENFTRDRRPRGSAPIHSARNQARIAIVTELMRRLEVDLLMVMETGYDVGPAMTGIANRLEQTLQAPARHGVHPLVSPPTGALPSVKSVYANVNLGQRIGAKALALRTLFEVYHVTSHDAQRPVTPAQLATGWALLREASSAAGAVLPPLAETDVAIAGTGSRCFPHPGLAGGLRGELVNDMGLAKMDDELRDQVYTLAGDIAGLIGMFSEQVPDLAPGTQHRDLYDDLCDGVQLLRDIATLAHGAGATSEIRNGVIARAQGLELVLLFFLQALAGGIPQDDKGLVFASRHASGDRATLAAYLCAMSASLRFDAIDKVLGPLGGAVDNDVVLDQLQRLGLVERHIETYGMVYLPPCANALERLFATGVREHGYKGGLDEQAAGYDIVRGALSGGGFSIQRQGGLLNWRSALQVTIPVSETLSVPLALFHTRYSGSAAITAQYKREGYKGEEPAVKARVETMIQMAQALLPGHSQFGMPLIVGDFNIPADYLGQASGRGAPAQRKRAIGQRLHDGMAACGYLRHTQGAQLRAGHPLTTLKSFGALALGESGSQPYDGTYEPFDFAQRGAVLRSGVVAPGAIITDEAMQAPIRAAVVASDVAVDLDAGDSDDANSQNAGQDDNESASPGEFADGKVIDAVADQMARVYLAAARRLLRRIVEMEPWFQRVEGAAQRGRAKKTKYASGIPTPKLVQDIATLRDAAANRLPQLIAQREQWFVQSCIKQDTVDNYATALGSADPFDAYRALLASIAQQARACKIRDKTLDGLAGELEQIGTQLANLETRRDIRKAVAYRAVVSDHLPQIVEIDLEPGP